jgi:hypothetical protein
MKTKKIFSIIVIGLMCLVFNPAIADGPPPPPGGHGGSGNATPPSGGGAPIDGGLSILLALAAAFGAKKVYDMRKKEKATT